MNTSHDDATGWFDPLYAAARGDVRAIPWASGRPSRWVTGLVAEHPGPGRAVVVGCGLGDDAEAVSAAGYDTVAFDVSATAIDWCRERFPGSTVDYRVEDVFDLPADLIDTGDLVMEVRTIQSLPPEIRSAAIDGVASLVASGGRLLVVAFGRPDHVPPTGPPWPVADAELHRFGEHGLAEVSAAIDGRQFIRTYRRR